MLATVSSPLEIIESNLLDMDPLPTVVEPHLRELPGIRAVLFDIYGTLLISAAGDVQEGNVESSKDAMGRVLAKAGISTTLPTGELLGQFQGILQGHQDLRRKRGITYPEVEIRAVWRDFVRHISGMEPSLEDTGSLATWFEMWTNPVCLMPGAQELLRRISTSPLLCGLVSNAQFYTRPVLETCLGQTLESLGIPGYLTAFSYEFLEGKPSTAMFEYCANSLDEVAGIRPEETLFVGNDRLKDLYPANQVGFQTALFAGDARSLRLREEEPLCEGLEPDLIITELGQLAGCLLG